MPIFLVVGNTRDCQFQIPGVEVVSARTYLTDPHYSEVRGAKVFNLCRSYRYHSLGYYVSLLAAARGHRHIPNTTTIQDMKSPNMIRFVGEELDELIQQSLAPVHSHEFTLSIYFGQNLAKRYSRISRHLSNMFETPLLRATFTRRKSWKLTGIEPLALSEVPEDHRPFITEAAKEYFQIRRGPIRKPVPRYDLAILYDEKSDKSPSDEKAIRKFVKAAESFGLGTEIVGRDDYGRIGEFDALFIRETTEVNHHTYRFARRAAAEGLVVIDDPESILKCTNKVYLAELFERYEVPIPKTVIVHKDNLEEVAGQLGLPCVLKRPDSSFSQGVVKVTAQEELIRQVEDLLERSELIVAQEFLPTPFDWRVGIIDGEPLYVCKYHMARDHWQIIKWGTHGVDDNGRVETMAVEQAPRQVVRTALRAANLIGDGLYGVDLKQVGRRCCVIEVNDNPNIDAGFEDHILKDELYARIMSVFLKRIERRTEVGTSRGDGVRSSRATL